MQATYPIFIVKLLSCFSILISASSFADCPPVGQSIDDLKTLKTSQWQINDATQRQQTALALLDCLSKSNPLLRDEIAFEALSFWMRAELLSTETVQQIREQLLKQISDNTITDEEGFTKPFAALVLAEVARIDRRKAFLSDAQRHEMVNAAALYLRHIVDFRGFDETRGWRHGVAHAADWMMQLSLNPALNKTQHETMLNALAQQIRNDQHFYQYGEAERLMTPVFYLGLRSSLTKTDWETWFASLLTTSLDLTKTTQASLARKHNLTAFLSALYVNLRESNQTLLQEKLLPLVTKSMKKLN
jgi:hypothetical protein